MVIFSSTAVLVQVIKLAVFFASLGLPAVHGSIIEVWRENPAAFAQKMERPHSNPRRQER